MESKNPALEKLERTHKLTMAAHDMRLWRSRLLDSSVPNPGDVRLQRRQEYALRKAIEDLDRLILNLRYHGGDGVPEDLDGYLTDLRASIPEATK